MTPNLSPEVPSADLQLVRAAPLSANQLLEAHLLDSVNSTLEGLGCQRRFRKLPSEAPQSELLLSKKVLMVDDTEAVVTSFLPHLMVATRGTAACILHTTESLQSLADKVLAKDADLILMDYTLANNIMGGEVVSLLRQMNCTTPIVAFSSDSHFNKKLLAAGANYGVVKDTFRPAQNVTEMSRGWLKLRGSVS